VIFEFLIAVFVKRAVVLIVTQCRLIEIYLPSFSTIKLEVVGPSIFMVETEVVASSKIFVSFYQTSYPES
jgi:hypothetical protein